MKMNKKLLMLGATFVLAAQFDTVAMAVDGVGDVVALVVAPLAVNETQTMNFGTVAGGPTAGTISMDINGNRTVLSGDAQIITTGAGLPGIFTITGEAGAAITVTTPDTTATLTGGGGADMGFTLISPTFPTTVDGTDLQFGGVLSIGVNQGAGSYTTVGDTYTVQVNYN